MSIRLFIYNKFWSYSSLWNFSIYNSVILKCVEYGDSSRMAEDKKYESAMAVISENNGVVSINSFQVFIILFKITFIFLFKY